MGFWVGQRFAIGKLFLAARARRHATCWACLANNQSPQADEFLVANVGGSGKSSLRNCLVDHHDRRRMAQSLQSQPDSAPADVAFARRESIDRLASPAANALSQPV